MSGRRLAAARREVRLRSGKRIVNGEIVVRVEIQEEFLDVLTHRLDVDGLVIEAPDSFE